MVKGREQYMHLACTQSAWPQAEALAHAVGHPPAYGPDPLGQGTPLAAGLMQSRLPAVIVNPELRIVWANVAAGKISGGGPAEKRRGGPLAGEMTGVGAGPAARC